MNSRTVSANEFAADGVARRASAFADTDLAALMPAKAVIQPKAAERRIHSLALSGSLNNKKEKKMTRINAYLHFAGNCREAMTFYQECLGGRTGDDAG